MGERRNNPILRVAQRDQDYRPPESGGGGTTKEIVEVTPQLRENLCGKIGEISASLDDSFRLWPEIPAVAKLTQRWSPKIGQCVKVDSLTLLKEDYP